MTEPDFRGRCYKQYTFQGVLRKLMGITYVLSSLLSHTMPISPKRKDEDSEYHGVEVVKLSISHIADTTNNEVRYNIDTDKAL
jgi:hypothetical protein